LASAGTSRGQSAVQDMTVPLPTSTVAVKSHPCHWGDCVQIYEVVSC
jgi:hypothetical protein